MTGQKAPTGGEDDGADRLDQLIRQIEALLASGEYQGALALIDQVVSSDRWSETTGTIADSDDRYRDLRSRHVGLLRAHADLGLAVRAAEALSEVDPLTGLYNRRYLEHFIPHVVAEGDPGTEVAAIAVVDIDGFKRVNDEVGYSAGDAMLREVASELQRLCRRADAVARLGGDEFVIVLRGASGADAHRVFERIRSTISDRDWSGVPDSMGITTSIGYTMASPDSDQAQLIDAASQAMQQAKRGGGNRVLSWTTAKKSAPDRRSGR